jgi:hypothetical protein
MVARVVLEGQRALPQRQLVEEGRAAEGRARAVWPVEGGEQREPIGGNFFQTDDRLLNVK